MNPYPTTFFAPSIGSSFDDKEAKAIIDSIEETMKDIKPQFVFETCKPSKKKEESKATSAFVWNSNQEPTKKKRNVKFAPLSELCQVEYIDTPSPSECKHLYCSKEEKEAFVQEMLQDLDHVDQGRSDSENWTARGLEAGMEQGLVQSKEYCQMVWDAVLDEQDRQGGQDICDDMAIAWASLEATQEAREKAHLVGIRDQEVIYGEDYNLEQEEKEGLMEEDSMATNTTVSLETSLSTLDTWW